MSARRALIGLVLFVPSMVAGGLFWFGTRTSDPLVGVGATVSTMLMFVGMVLLAPFVILPLVRLMARPLHRVMPAEGRLAADAAQSNPGRTAATAATLLVALSVVVVNATVASSFVGSVKQEIDRRSRAISPCSRSATRNRGRRRPGSRGRCAARSPRCPRPGPWRAGARCTSRACRAARPGRTRRLRPVRVPARRQGRLHRRAGRDVLRGLAPGGVVPPSPTPRRTACTWASTCALRGPAAFGRRRSSGSPTRSTRAARRSRCRWRRWPPSTA